jgi:hypothetical protein
LQSRHFERRVAELSPLGHYTPHESRHRHQPATEGSSVVQDLLWLPVFALPRHRRLFTFLLLCRPERHRDVRDCGSHHRRSLACGGCGFILRLLAPAHSHSATLALDFRPCSHLPRHDECVLSASVHSTADFLAEARDEAVFRKELSMTTPWPNQTLQRTRRGRCRCNPGVCSAGSLSFLR